MGLRRRSNQILHGLLGLLLCLMSSCTVGPCGVTWLFVGGADDDPAPTTRPTLPEANYAAAEAVYRSMMPGGNWRESTDELVYCLSFDVPGAPVPADFLKRFDQPTPRVTADSHGLESRPGATVERKSGQKVVMLKLLTLSIEHDHAEARVLYAPPSMAVTATLRLAQQDGRWVITEVKEESRNYF
jgi:hypothetical protein